MSVSSECTKKLEDESCFLPVAIWMEFEFIMLSKKIQEQKENLLQSQLHEIFYHSNSQRRHTIGCQAGDVNNRYRGQKEQSL